MRHHADRVVVAKHAVDGTADHSPKLRKARERRLKRSKCLPPKVASQNANIVAQRRNHLSHALHGSLAHIAVEIAQMEDREAVERIWQFTRLDEVLSQLDALGILSAAPEHSSQLEHVLDGEGGET